MNKITYFDKVLAHLQETEGEEFQFQEAQMIEELERQEENTSTLAIKVLSVIGGMMATITFLVFLFLAGLHSASFWGYIFLGLSFIAAALWVTKISKHLVLDTICITSYVTGYILLFVGFEDLNLNENISCAIFLILAVAVPFISQNYIFVFLSTLTAGGCLLFLIGNTELYFGIHFYVAGMAALMSIFYLNEAKIISNNGLLARVYQPLRIGLTFCLLMGLLFLGTNRWTEINIQFIWLSFIITIGVVLYIISLVLKKFHITDQLRVWGIYGAVVLSLLPTAFAPAVSGAILLILLSFYVNYKTGFALGIISFIYFLSQYYYDLKLTLLSKSGILILSGALFLFVFLYLNKYTPSNEKI